MKIELSRRRTRQRERGLQQIQLELDAQIKLEALSLPLALPLSLSPASPSFPLSLSSLCRLIFTEAAAQINKKQTQQHFRFCIEYELYLLKIHECLPSTRGSKEEGGVGVNR